MENKWHERLKNKLKFLLSLFAANEFRTGLLQAFPFWIASLLTGLVAVFYTKLFGLAEHFSAELLKHDARLIFVLAPVSFLFAWMLVRIFAPNARGSGIPQVMAAIDLAVPKHENKLGWLLSLRILITKVASSLLMIFGGGAIGREGPTIQIAGSVFYTIHRWIPKSWPKLSNQGFILTGAAAGLAAAFNTPLGGVVFAMEELAKIHVRFFRMALFTAVIIAGLTAQAILGPYLYLGYPRVVQTDFGIFFSVVAVALLTGMAGTIMCKLILLVMRWKQSFTTVKNVLFIIAAGLAVAALAYFVNMEVLGSGKETINEVLFTNEKASSWQTVLMRIAGPIICFNTGAAGGVFAPSLAAGASLGGYVAGILNITGSQANVLILSGMVGFLTGVTRTPFTSAILVLEMTDRHSVIFHLLLAALISNLGALIIDKHSFYERLKKGYVEDVRNRQQL